MDELVALDVDVGSWRIGLLRPASAEDLIDEEAFARDEFLPYWAELWPSAVALARHVHALPLAGVRVLELGCGLGLVSITAALAGGDVLATDWSEDALRATKQNAERNDVTLETALVRWSDAAFLEPAGLVLAADVLYEDRNAKELAALLPEVVAHGGTALLADPGRTHAKTFLGEMSVDWQLDRVERLEIPRGAIHRLRRNEDTE
ncbi:MAG TPA: 50S ribosomal protein L11 methyltransferase [Gaiellaceae bacterium]